MARTNFKWNPKRISRLGKLASKGYPPQKVIRLFRQTYPSASPHTIAIYKVRIFGNARTNEEVAAATERWDAEREANKQGHSDRIKEHHENGTGVFGPEIKKKRGEYGRKGARATAKLFEEKLTREFGRMPTPEDLAARQRRIEHEANRRHRLQAKTRYRTFHELISFIKSKPRGHDLLNQRAKNALRGICEKRLKGEEYTAFSLFIGLSEPRISVAQVAQRMGIGTTKTGFILKRAVRRLSRWVDIIEIIKTLTKKRKKPSNPEGFFPIVHRIAMQ